MDEKQRESDIAALSADLKKLNDDHKRSFIPTLKKSADSSDRALAAAWERALANDTSTMLVSPSGTARRIGKDGRPTGGEFRKEDSGAYAPAQKPKAAPKKMASGGTVRGAGCAVRGVKKCKVV